MNASERKRRWFHPTPGWLVFASLATSVFLLLSHRYQWFAFSQYRWAIILFLVTNVGVTLVVLLLWFITAMLIRRRFQFTIRSLLLLAVAIALPCGWAASRMREAKLQRQGVALVERLGGDVHLGADHMPDLWEKMHWLLPDAVFGEAEFVEFKSHKGELSSADLSEIVRLLPHIQILFLKSCGIADGEVETLTGLKELQWLSLSNNNITDAGLRPLLSLDRLRALDLDSTSITDNGLELLEKHHLWRLSLSGTQVGDVGLTWLRGHKLHSLTLDGTQISDAGLTHLVQQGELQLLNLSNTRITDAGLASIGGLKELGQLDLSRTKVSDNGIKLLGGITILLDLNLSDTQITDRALEYLKSKIQLDELNLTNTNVTDHWFGTTRRIEFRWFGDAL